MRLYVFILFFSITTLAKNEFDKQSFLKKTESIQKNLLACLIKTNKDLQTRRKLSYSTTNWSYDKPLIYNWKILTDRFESAWQSLDSKLKIVAQSGDLQECSEVILKKNWKHLQEIADVEGTSVRLLRKENTGSALVYRWADLRGYLTLKKKLDSKLLNPKTLIKDIDSTTKKLLLEMCRNSDPNSTECNGYWENLKRSSLTLGDVYSELKTNSQALHEYFFSIHPDKMALHVIATNKRNTLELTVLMNLEAIGDLKAPFIEAIQAYWNISGLKINISDSKDPMVPFIKLNDNRANYVNYDNPKEMGLQKDFLENPYDFAEVIAHEFGHILGFRDCYLEFYDDEIDAFVFYSLDPKNIMCGSSSYDVTPSHLKELRRTYFK